MRAQDALIEFSESPGKLSPEKVFNNRQEERFSLGNQIHKAERKQLYYLSLDSNYKRNVD